MPFSNFSVDFLWFILVPQKPGNATPPQCHAAFGTVPCSLWQCLTPLLRWTKALFAVLGLTPLFPGRAMAQVVGRRPLTAEARVRARVNPCGICGGQSGTVTGFSPSSSGFSCQYHSTVALQTRIIWGIRNMLTSVGIHAWVLDPPHLQGKKCVHVICVWGRVVGAADLYWKGCWLKCL
jgi:hypothetical protein